MEASHGLNLVIQQSHTKLRNKSRQSKFNKKALSLLNHQKMIGEITTTRLTMKVVLRRRRSRNN